jgi:hypothetical protein
MTPHETGTGELYALRVGFLTHHLGPCCAARVIQNECESRTVWAVTYMLRHHGLSLSQTKMVIG